MWYSAWVHCQDNDFILLSLILWGYIFFSSLCNSQLVTDIFIGINISPYRFHLSLHLFAHCIISIVVHVNVLSYNRNLHVFILMHLDMGWNLFNFMYREWYDDQPKLWRTFYFIVNSLELSLGMTHLKLGHNRFVPPVPFLIHYSFHHSTLYNPLYIVVK